MWMRLAPQLQPKLRHGIQLPDDELTCVRMFISQALQGHSHVSHVLSRLFFSHLNELVQRVEKDTLGPLGLCRRLVLPSFLEDQTCLCLSKASKLHVTGNYMSKESFTLLEGFLIEPSFYHPINIRRGFLFLLRGTEPCLGE